MSTTQNPITFAEHKELTAKDCEQIAEQLMNIAKSIREGNMSAFEKFWWKDGTEEGDAKITMLQELVVLRYVHRQDHLKD